MDGEDTQVQIRPATPADSDAVAALAHRLEEGVAKWRDEAAVAAAVREWVRGSMEKVDREDHAVFVADAEGAVVGFISVGEQRHWSGAIDAGIGELVVAIEHSGRGVGRRLVDAAIEWARERALERVTLSTGAANQNARSFYRALGFDEEDVTLSRAV